MLRAVCPCLQKLAAAVRQTARADAGEGKAPGLERTTVLVVVVEVDHARGESHSHRHLKVFAAQYDVRCERADTHLSCKYAATSITPVPTPYPSAPLVSTCHRIERRRRRHGGARGRVSSGIGKPGESIHGLRPNGGLRRSLVGPGEVSLSWVSRGRIST